MLTFEEWRHTYADVFETDDAARAAWTAACNRGYRAGMQDTRELLAAHSAGAQEPVAWMRDAGENSISTMTCCCTDAVKQLWLKVNPEQVERYTIPLYAHPQPMPQTDAARDAAWLIEWPAEESMPARWWNPLPNMGWVTDATRAVRFARKDDAEAYIHCGRHQFVAGVIATEHIFDAEIERLDRAKGE